MTTVLVWILLNATTGKPGSPYYFATQSDCLRAGMRRENVTKTRDYYECIQENIANTYVIPQPPTPNPRAERNYKSEQDQINRILSNPPNWHPAQS